MTTRYVVRSHRTKKYWVVHDERGLRFPAVRQLWRRLVCRIRRHEWSEWVCDDYEGPGELMEPDDPDSFMPYCNRRARDGEWASRHCTRGGIMTGCGWGQERVPADEAPPLFAGKIMSIHD